MLKGNTDHATRKLDLQPARSSSVTSNNGMLNLRNLDYFQLLKESGRGTSKSSHKAIRLALLADCATQHFVPLLRALFNREGIRAELYEGGFDAIELEARNPQAGLYELQPDVVVILNSVQMLRDRYHQRSSEPSAFQQETLQRLKAVWD